MKSIIVLLVFSLSISAFAQDFKFGNVSKEELKEGFYALDSSVSACYLYKYRDTYFEFIRDKGFRVVTNVHERIKIYNSKGFKYATRSISLGKDGGDKELLGNIKAYTFNLVEGDKIEEVKLKKDGVFNIQKTDYYDETRITMPNIKEGSVIEYKYRKYSPFFWHIDDFVFQHEIPVNKVVATFEFPEFYGFNFNKKGFVNFSQKKSLLKDKITFLDKTRTDVTSGQTGSYNSYDLDFMKHKHHYDLSYIPALKDEPFVNNIDNYRAAAMYELSYTHFPRSLKTNYSTTWEEVVKTIYKSNRFGDEIKKEGYYADDIDVVSSKESDPYKKAIAVYEYIKSKVRWNGIRSKYTSKGVKKAYKDQEGNVAEINLMLTSMLRYIGLSANPVILSTRDNGAPLFPTIEGFDYVICAVSLRQGILLLDATDKNAIPNILPMRTLNWNGRIISKEGRSALVDLYPETPSKTTVKMMVDLNSGGTIKGHYREIKTNHEALSFREKLDGFKEDDYLQEIESEFPNIEVSDFEIINLDNIYEPIAENYKFNADNQADVIGVNIYFSPMFFLGLKENPFKLEKREFPVDFGYPSEQVYQIEIAIPEGYIVESLPEKETFSLPENIGGFTYNIVEEGAKINLFFSYRINSPIINPDDYEVLKSYFNMLVEKTNQKIVLTKK